MKKCIFLLTFLIFLLCACSVQLSGDVPDIAIYHNAPIPNLKLWSGIITDWWETEPITEDTSGLYVLGDTITVGVVFSALPELDAPGDSLGYFIVPGIGSALYFAEDGSDTETVRIDITLGDEPIETDIHIMHINMHELFPDGFSGQMWAVIVEPHSRDQIYGEWHGNRIDVVYILDYYSINEPNEIHQENIDKLC